MKSRIAVISDIHSNADALKIALKEVKKNNVDITVFLGDILTYGIQPLKVINMLEIYQKENSVVFIKGNHDQFYFDMQSGMNINELTNKLPKFIIESLNWTVNKISPFLLKNTFKWYENYFIGDIYFSHANFFSYGDWSYINKHDDLQRSFQKLFKKNVFAGVFGHSHRQLFIGKKENNLIEMNSFISDIRNIDQLIINAGSIGQPRGQGIGFLILDVNNNNLVKASFEKIHIDFQNSINLIKQSELSEETKKKLIYYLEI